MANRFTWTSGNDLDLLQSEAGAGDDAGGQWRDSGDVVGGAIQIGKRLPDSVRPGIPKRSRSFQAIAGCAAWRVEGKIERICQGPKIDCAPGRVSRGTGQQRT